MKIIRVKIPDNVPLDKLPWDSLPDALARLEGGKPEIVVTTSAKEDHLS